MIARLALLGVSSLLVIGACKGDVNGASVPTKESGATAPAVTGVPGAASDGAGFSMVDVKGDPADLGKLLAEEAGKAKTKGQKPFAYLWATWCQPCVKIKQSLRDPLMADAFRGTYIVKLDVDEWDKGLITAGLRSKAIPAFFQLDSEGKPTGRQIDGGAWGEDVPANMAPPLKAFFSG